MVNNGFNYHQQFPSQAEVPEDVDIKRLIAEFSITVNAIAVVVSVGQVIKDTPC
jgi:hypothetical protein